MRRLQVAEVLAYCRQERLLREEHFQVDLVEQQAHLHSHVLVLNNNLGFSASNVEYFLFLRTVLLFVLLLCLLLITKSALFLVDEIFFAVVLCELIGDIVEEIAPLRDGIVEILLDDFPCNFEVR